MAMNSDQQEEQLIQSDDVNEEKKERNSMFLPHKGFIATPILLGINVLVFILMTLSGVNLKPSNYYNGEPISDHLH